jgi:peptidoglycan/LPS O-acetylase OafA/YrhL
MEPDSREKFEFIEGTRGIAAVQVVALHYFTTFLPAFARAGSFAHFHWETRFAKTPLFFLADGYTAVFIFFLMSGFVLAPSFSSLKLGLLRQVEKRFLRLYIPVAAAIVLAVGLALSIGSQSTFVASMSHSDWVAALFHNPLTWRSLSKEFVASSMVLGYDGTSIFSSLAAVTHWFALSPITVSMDPPLWTLHAEFWGSILLIVTSRLYRALSPKVFWTIFVIALPVTGTSFFTLFLLGFAAYQNRKFYLRRQNLTCAFLGVSAITVGILAASIADTAHFAVALAVMSRFTFLQAYNGYQFQNEIAACLIMLGVLLLPLSRSILSTRIPLWLGKISFSLYLIHFPILFTIGLAFFTAVYAYLSYGEALSLTAIVVGGFTLVCASYFERWIDKWAVAFSKRMTTERS